MLHSHKTLAFFRCHHRFSRFLPHTVTLLWIEEPIMAASNRTVLQFSSSQTLSGKVHPLVIFNICDCYVRRPDQAERVIGTLLGSVLPDGTVDIRNSYAVPHNESVDQVLYSLHMHSFLKLLLFCRIFQCFIVEEHLFLNLKLEKLTLR